MTNHEKIIHLRQEIKELHSLLGLTRTRPEYLKAVKLWRKDTGESNLCYPDLGGHWAWALKYIEKNKKVKP